MPEMDGLEVCRLIRRTSDVPILFLSARDEEIDRILGLEMGGDDYVTKPFSPRELVTRVNVILRRARAQPAGDVPAPPPLAHGRLSLEPGSRTARFGDHDVSLTAIEFAIVKSLLGRPALVLSRAQLVDASHAASIHIAERTIDSHIRNIRAKLAEAGAADAIETVHGVGFRLGKCGG
jgi:two-component system OmpR family response regulator